MFAAIENGVETYLCKYQGKFLSLYNGKPTNGIYKFFRFKLDLDNESSYIYLPLDFKPENIFGKINNNYKNSYIFIYGQYENHIWAITSFYHGTPNDGYQLLDDYLEALKEKEKIVQRIVDHFYLYLDKKKNTTRNLELIGNLKIEI